MLKIANLEAGYGTLRVLKSVSLHVNAGEAVAVIGANGAGKTTLLKTVAGLIKSRAGEVLFDDRSLGHLRTERIMSLGCCLVPEGRHVFGTMTVRENLMLGAYGLPRSARAQSSEDLERIYSLFGILKERDKQLAGTLSGGQQQMLAIGRALMGRPRLLMMDEPSMGVAPLVVRDIYRTVEELKQHGLTILLVEQNAHAALGVADRGYVIETGQIVLQGTARELMDNPEVQRAYLGKEYRRIDE